MLSQDPAASHANGVLLELHAMGGMRVLDAVAQGIAETPLGRPYLSVLIHAVERRGTGPARSWRDKLRYWLARTSKDESIFPHSGPMTSLRFMLVEEGFAKRVDGEVTIDPMFASAVRLATSGLTRA